MVGQRDLAAVTPPTMRRILAAVQAFERMQLSPKDEYTEALPRQVRFLNSSGETIPPYGCVQPIGTVEFGGRVYIEVTRPMDLTSALQGPFLFNGRYEIEDGKRGVAQFGPIFRVKLDGGTYLINQRLGPVDASFAVGKGCVYSFLGLDDIADDVGLVIANSTPVHMTVGASDIPAGSSGIFKYRIPGSSSTAWIDTTIEHTGWNDSSTPLNAGDRGYAFPVDCRWSLVGIC